MVRSENCISSLFILCCSWIGHFRPNANEEWPPNWDNIWIPYVHAHTYTHTYIHMYIERHIYIANISQISVAHPRPWGESHWRHAVSSTRTNWEHLPWPKWCSSLSVPLLLSFGCALKLTFWVKTARIYCERPRNYMHSLDSDETIL